MKLAVINCGSDKLYYSAPAKNLYVGQLFSAARKFVEDNYDNYCILSAKYGCLSPNEIIFPYNIYIGDLSKQEKRNWDNLVVRQLLDKFPNVTELDFYTSKSYQSGIIPLLTQQGIKCVSHLNDLGLGYKIQWFLSHTKSGRKKLF